MVDIVSIDENEVIEEFIWYMGVIIVVDINVIIMSDAMVIHQ